MGFMLLAMVASQGFVVDVSPAAGALVSTDKADYAPGETVTITGSGFSPSSSYDVPVIRPDGSIVVGDGTFMSGWDTVTTNSLGGFTYLYQLNGIAGTYDVRVYPSPWSGNLAQIPVASTTFTDAVAIVDFKQCANQDPMLGTCHWIGSILNTGNSEYFESMSVPERVVLDGIGTTAGNVHTLTFSHQATKSGVHAYDFLTSYSQAIAAAAAAGVPFTDLNGQACDVEIGPPASLGATCNSVRNGANCIAVAVPDDPFISKDGSTQSRLNAYEALFGDRTIRICGNSPISAGSLVLSHSVTNGMDTGDSDINYTLSWTSPSATIVIEMGAHISLSGNPATNPLAWGVGLGASGISGGPYHFNLRQLDGAALGSQDNQIQGGATAATTSTTTSSSTSSSSTSSSSTTTSTSSSTSSSTSTSSTSTSSTSTSSTTNPACQHFKCYKAVQNNFPRFESRDVTLVDQFGPSTAHVTRPDRLCNPADKNGEGIGDSTLHGMCYRISESGFQRRKVLIENQFGSEILNVLRPETLCNPASKDGVPFVSDPKHYKCYRVRGTSRFSERTVNVVDQFEAKTTRVLRPLLLCNPVDKNGEGLVDPSCHLVCYRIRDAAGQAPFTPMPVTVEDQFAVDDLRSLVGECRRAAHICVPSTKTELP